MRVFSINSVPYGSTGNIMFSISKIVDERGEAKCATGYSFHDGEDHILIGNMISKAAHMKLAYYTGRNGCFSYFATKKLIKEIETFTPDIVHLHNLHGWYVNVPMLMEYLKKRYNVVWTLHDCWSFTGQCSHFTMINCNKWEKGCGQCPQYKSVYPPSCVDLTEKMWRNKKEWFSDFSNLTIVTPSKWLANKVSKSFLQDYPVRVINNGIDRTIFKPTQGEFRKKYNIEDKFVILGVSLGWDERKGLDIFKDIYERLCKKNSQYQIVMVGTNEDIDKKLPADILSIHRTHSKEELAEIYSAADVFVNPTLEENFPTVNIEAIACGTPVVTFNTGGAYEMLNEHCGVMVEYGDVDKMIEAIKNMVGKKPLLSELCVKQSKKYDKNDKFLEYVELYCDLLNKEKRFK